MIITHTHIKLFSLAMIASVFYSCGNKEKVSTPQGMSALSLEKYGKPFSIFVPDTNAVKYEIVEQTSGALDIISGNNFAVSINEQHADIELRKQDIKADEVNKLKSFIIEAPDAILWESEITRPEFHFVVNKTIGGSEYSFEDIRNLESSSFSREDIQRIFDSSKSISEIKK